MKIRMIISLFVIVIMLVTSGMSINALTTENIKEFDIANSKPQNVANGYTNITVNETWDLLTDATTIEVPIDVRRIDEWRTDRIDTPFPEHPRWVKDLHKNATILPKFLEQYDGCNVVLYCKGAYRSFIATKLLIANNFTGKIYNMIGGIMAWHAAGLPTTNGHIYNITANETWYLCNDILNGRQKPIDVRRKDEWNAGFIDTPYPENPLWFILDDIKNDTIRPIFMEDHYGEELIMYCKGGYRSLIAAYYLYYDNFTGTLYNMLGGITAWNASGLPFRNDNPPDAPKIKGPRKVRKEKVVNFTFNSTDPDGDVLLYHIDWGDGNEMWTDEYSASGKEVKASHNWTDKGEYTITVYTKDNYGNESVNATFKLQVPKPYNFNFNLLEWLFEQFPKVFPILRYILRQ